MDQNLPLLWASLIFILNQKQNHSDKPVRIAESCVDHARGVAGIFFQRYEQSDMSPVSTGDG